MGRDRNWTDKFANASDIFELAATKPLSIISAIPDIAGELKKENMAPINWNAVNEICALTRSLAGEIDSPKNPMLILSNNKRPRLQYLHLLCRRI